MYDQFYQLKTRPFQLTPDPYFYFESGTHRKALSYLGYGLAQGEGFIAITGDVGAGKSTLVAHLMDTIDPSRLTAVKLVSTQVGGDDMLRLAAQQFGIDTTGLTKADLLRHTEQALMDNARSGKRTLLIVDEAQCMDISALEELRMLSNFQLGGQALLQIFLLGQPEFRDLLMTSPALEQLRQRVIATHHLEPMMADEIGPYIEHRLTKAGWIGNPQFTPEAYAAMYEFSEGIPRKLNILATRVLLFGAMEQLRRIDGHHVMDVIRDMTGAVEEDAVDAAPSIAVPPQAAVEMAPVAMVEPEPMVLDVIAPEPTQEAPVAAPAPAPAPVMAAVAAPPAPLQSHVIAPEPVMHAVPQMAFAQETVQPSRWDESDIAATPRDDAREASQDAMIEHLTAKLAQMESRLDAQDAALRRVLNMLIGWAERDGTGVNQSRAA